MCKMAMAAEMSSQKLDAGHLVKIVDHGAKYDDGKEVRAAV